MAIRGYANTSTSPTLTPSAVKQTSATLTITNHTGAWWYKGTQSGATCTARSSAQTTAALTGLSGGTSYTYKAYSNSTCATELTSSTTDAEFTTLDLEATSVTHNSATLTISNHTGSWWYKQTSPSTGTCTARSSTQTTADLTGLAASTSHTYKAYSASGCADANEIASETFTTLSLSPPTLTGWSRLQSVSYIPSLSNAPGSGDWQPSFRFVSGRPLRGNLPALTTTSCTAGTLEAGWYRSGALTTPIASQSTLPPHTSLSFTPTAPGEYLVLAYCVRGAGASKTYSTAVNLMGTNGKVTITAPARLTASAVTPTGATLTRSNFTGTWYYRADKAPHNTCSTAQSGNSVNLTGLSANTSYTYKAFSNATCTTELTGNATDAEFTTTVAAPTPASATLTGFRYTGTQRSPPAGSAAWNESFAFASGTVLGGSMLATNVTCATGTTAEIGWYKSTALTARLGTHLSNASGDHTLTYTPTLPGEYRALAYCKSGTVYSAPVNLMRTNGRVTLTAAVAPPTNLRAAAGNAQATLSWTGAAGATGYQYRRARQDGGTCTEVPDSAYNAWAAAGTASPFTATGLTNDRRYCFQLRSRKGTASSVPSGAVAAKPAAAPLAPVLTAKPGHQRVRLTWTTAPDGPAWTGWEYQRKSKSGACGTTGYSNWTAVSGGAAARAVLLTSGLSNGTAYCFRVRATTSGAASAAAEATPRTNRAATGKPAIDYLDTRVGNRMRMRNKGTLADADGLTRLRARGWGRQMTYQWIREDGGDVDIAGATDWWYILRAADVGKKVKLKVSFADDGGNAESRTSDPTPTVRAAPGLSAPSAAPRLEVVRNDGGNVELRWPYIETGSKPDGGRFEYRLKTTGAYGGWQSACPSGWPVCPGTVGLSLSGLPVGTAHAIQVRGRNNAGPGPASAEVSVTPLASNAAPVFTQPAATCVIGPGNWRSGLREVCVSMPENTTAAAVVAATDADAGDTVTYSVPAQENLNWQARGDQGQFEIDATTGVLSFKTAPDYEKRQRPGLKGRADKYVVRVRATSGTGNRAQWTDQVVEVTVTDTDEAPTGEPTLSKSPESGAPTVGDVFTAVVSGIRDPDGLSDPGWTYQWVREASGVDTDIPGATLASYTLVSGDATNKVKVRVSFTDDGGFAGSLTSAASATIERIGDASDPAAAATATLEVSPGTVSEGLPVTVRATLSAALAEAVSIPLTVTRGTSEESDHGTLASIPIAAGETTGSVGIATSRDLDGDDETFTVALDTDSLPASVTAGDPSSATVTIDDTVTGETIVPVLFPNPPAIVEARPGDGQVTLAWSGVAGAMGWEVERDGSGTWTATGGDATGHTVTDLTNGTEYSFRVRATGLLPALKGTASASVSATPAPAPGPVGAIAVTHNGSSLAVTWDAPARATHYDVTYTDTGNGETGRAAWNRAGTSLTIACDIRAGYENRHCIDAGSTYTVGVRARNANGESAWANSAPASRPAPVQPAAPPDAVAEVRVTHKGSSLEVSWDAPARATHYDVTYSGNGADARAAWNRAGTTLTIACDSRYPGENRDCIDAGSAYTVGVRARNANGESAWANSAPAQPPTAAPDPVAEVRVTHNGSNLSVSWDAPARATHYDVTYTDAGSGQNARAAWNRAGTSLTITCDSRYPGEDRHCVDGAAAYRVGVRARNAAGESAWANSAATARPALSVADATVDEPGAGASASLDFVVTLDPASTGRVTVAYATGKAGDTATKGSDYTDTSGTLTFAAGETSKTVSVPVLPDAHDDGGETLTLTLSNASGARIADGEATGTIANDGPMPRAWTARFGRTVADQVIGAVEARMQAPRTPGAEVSLAGERIGLGPLFGAETGDGAEADAARDRAEARKEEDARREALRLAEWLKGGPGADRRGFGAEAGAETGDRSMAGRELLLGSSFSLTAGTAGGGSAAFWGRGTVTNFNGREGETSLDGEVTTALLGADWSREKVTAGLILGHSMGEGGYRGASGGGTVSSTLTGLYPWGRYAASERVTLWGVAGWGEGTLELTPENADPGSGPGQAGARQAAMRADLELAMGAAGLRGMLLDGGENGLTLTAKTDAMAVRTSTGRGRGASGTLAASEATVTRLRLGLEASRPVALDGSGATLTPSLEAGVRQDGGDAETGFGVDLGGGLAFTDPGLGLEAEIRARGLLTHEADGFRERGLSGALHWRQRSDSDRGATLSLTQTVGGSSSGGAEALLTRTTLEGLAANDNGGGDDLRARHLEVKLGYGLSGFSDRFTLTPEAGAGFAGEGGRDYRLGLRLTPAGDAGAFELSFEALRREAADDGGGAGAAEHEAGFRLQARW